MSTPHPTRRRLARIAAAVIGGAVAGTVVLGSLTPTASGASAEVGTTAAAQASEVAVTVDQVGWWSSRFGAGARPENGFEVAVGGDGTVQSVAAVQLTVSATAVDSLPVRLVEDAAFAEFASLTACATATGWAPANPGPLEDAPTPDCTRKVPLTRSADAMVWLGDLAPLAPQGGTVSVMFVPGYSSPAGTGPGAVLPFSELQAEATGSNQVSTTTTSSPSASTPPTTIGTGGGFVPSNPVRPTSTVVVDPVPPDPSGATTTTVVSSDPRSGPSDEEFFSLGEVEDAAAETKPWGRLLVLIPLSALIGFGSVRIYRELSDRDLLPGAR